MKSDEVEVQEFALKAVSELMAKVRAKWSEIHEADDDYIGDSLYLCLKRNILDLLEDQE